LLTLAHAISRTKVTAPRSTADGATVSSVIAWCSVRTRTDQAPAAKVRISAAAVAASASGRSRAITPSERSFGFCAWRAGASGVQSCANSGKRKPSGITPTMV
jgi:hypothetical protein